LTWANHGADGGDLLAAAVSNGVPHPPGYPLYTFLLQGWLLLLGWTNGTSSLAWRGNLLSAVTAAAAVALTAVTLYGVLGPSRARVWVAGVAAFAWGITPLLWGQAILTEVYALHALIVAMLGWATLRRTQSPAWLALPVALGVAHHLTLLLLLPAVLYWSWSRAPDTRLWLRALGWMVIGSGIGFLFYGRVLLVSQHVPPVNWGYALDGRDLWWLVSGAAYRRYLVATDLGGMVTRVAAWARTVGIQYTLPGLFVILLGLSTVDQEAPRLRTFGVIWIVPISIYSILYVTFDSDVYLLPVSWMMALWLAFGLMRISQWKPGDSGTGQIASVATMAAAVLVVGLMLLQWPRVSLSQDRSATDFVAGAATALEPNAIVISRGDEETFALWYGTWATGELAEAAPGLVPVNDSLYQFDWYGRLQADLYPGLDGVDDSAEALVVANAGSRPIYYADEVLIPEGSTVERVGPLWRLTVFE
jgi:hypothetical protein